MEGPSFYKEELWLEGILVGQAESKWESRVTMTGEAPWLVVVSQENGRR